MEPLPITENVVTKDISTEFITMDALLFLDFLRQQRKEPSLAITVNWTDAVTANRLKAFLEGSTANQVRTATIRATEAQHLEAANAFASGVKWEKTEI